MGLEGVLERPLSSVLLWCWGTAFLDLFPVSFSSRSFSGWLAPVYSLLMILIFPSTAKRIHIKVIDGERIRKNKNCFLEMMVPRMVDMSFKKGVVPCHTH